VANTVKPTPLEQLQPAHFKQIINRNEQTSTSLAAFVNEFEDEGNDIDTDLEIDSSQSTKQGLASSVFNLVKANLGSGVFALPAGIATFGDVPSIIVPAALIMCALGSFSAYSFNMIPRLTRMDESNCHKRTMSISQAWEKEVGKESAWIVSLCCFLTPLGTALTFSIVLGDMLSMLSQSMGLSGMFMSRQALLMGVTSSVVYPLCNLKSLAALSPVSMVGVTGMCLTAAFMVLRALPSSPYMAAGSTFLNSIPALSRPSFGLIGNKVLSPSLLILVSMCATSLLVHFSAHDFCDDLSDNTTQRFKKLTGIGFSFTVLMNIIFMAAGFLTFGGNCQSMVLNNYSPKDIGATLSRLVVAVSLVGSYPILFRAIKSSFFELTHKGKEVSEKFNKRATQSLLGCLTVTALFLKDAGIVVSLNGAVMGSAIIYAFPSIIFLKLTERLVSQGKLQKTRKLMIERFVNKALVGTGGLIAVLGGTVILLSKLRPGLL